MLIIVYIAHYLFVRILNFRIIVKCWGNQDDRDDKRLLGLEFLAMTT